MTLRLISIAVLLLQIGLFGVPARTAESKSANIQMTILANEGLLIRSADSGILIDAFVEVEETERNAVSTTTIRDMLAGHPPFSSIRLAIVSHRHREHFDAMTAGTFLKNNRESILVSTAEVIQAMRDEYPEYPAIQDRMKEIGPNRKKTTSMTVSGIKLDFMLFSHEASDFYPEQVLTHIIHLDGRKILFVGDSEMRPESMRPFNLRAQGIDIIVVPLWLFKDESVRALIDEYVAPKNVVVVQIPPGGLETVTKLSRTFPDVVFLSELLASAEF